MQRIILIALLLIMISGLSAGNINWQHNIEDALQQAKQENKHVFVFFTGSDWCSWCFKLIEEVFDTPEFQNYVAENMVMVELDFPRGNLLSESQKSYNQEKQQKYGIQGYPSVLILDTDGKVVVQTGYRPDGGAAYVKFLEESINWKLDKSNSTWQDPQGLIWQKNLENALDIATKQNKYVFIDFTGSDWCVWCERLEDEVFSKPEFADFVNDNLVLVRFDFPQNKAIPAGEENYNRQMAQKYGVRGFPTIFLMDNKGEIVEKLGYQKGGAVPYVEMLQKLINK